jgi:DNA-binding NtrC family response regulator
MPRGARPALPVRLDVTLQAAVDQLEREMIRVTLDRSAGNISEASRNLGLTRRGLYLKMRRLGLEGRANMDNQ